MRNLLGKLLCYLGVHDNQMSAINWPGSNGYLQRENCLVIIHTGAYINYPRDNLFVWLMFKE